MPAKLSKRSGLLIAGAAVLVLMSVFLPWWGMNFYAPQYPEGLTVKVFPYKLEGEIDIINSLNHYIGMKTFSEETFPELKVLPYILVALGLLTLVSAWLRRKRWLYILLGVYIAFAIVGLYDIRRWLVDFGTDLNPQAPITVEPFVPPVFGKNVIANFETFSFFSYGAAAFGLAFMLMLISLWKERDQ
ncbi:hypothetical protein J2S00_001861 [Caldalkalibacillus uzonensis]|uniref:Copper chaperone NosL n=1 Tax=Caldalkalibacillus uzonensis TaxID=353224 RepID=A0ABU0CU79_9BACI|nr:hypothetical protein [Caldalkalibacillus uzonensis]MDQ0339075.1 hypothetical protein [Caldalkalibacillus uzonensis]